MAKSKAVVSEFDDEPVQDAKPVKADKPKKPVEYFEEWTCQINTVDGKNVAEKLKLKRKCVKITAEQADVLNHGRLTGGNTYADMYFRPE